MRPFYRPHYASCHSVPYELVTRKQKRTKIKIGIHVLHGMSKWSANFQLKRSKMKATGHEKPPQSGAFRLLTAANEAEVVRRRLHTRPMPLLLTLT